MKGITGNPALDAYQRFAVKPVSQPKAAESARAGEQARSPEAASVTISSEARALASADAPYNSQKVEALRAAISDGTFQVNSQVVAQRMLNSIGA